MMAALQVVKGANSARRMSHQDGAASFARMIPGSNVRGNAMTKTNTTFNAEISTLSDSELSQTVGGWGCHGYGNGGYGYNKGGCHNRKDYCGDKGYGYGHGYKPATAEEVNQTANVVIVINQNA
jgi:hypothetical protein